MLVGIHTNGIGQIDMSNKKTTKTREEIDQKASEAFASLVNMNQNVSATDFAGRTTMNRAIGKNVDSALKNGVSTRDAASVFDMRDVKMNRSYGENTVDSLKDNQDADATVGKEIQKTNNKDTRKPDGQTEKSKTDDNSVQDRMQDATVQIRESVKNTLDVDDEELDQLLQEFGIQITDLLNADTLKDFVLKVQDASEVDMLINEDLNFMMNQLLEDINQLKTELNISEKELTDMSELVSEPLINEEQLPISKSVEISQQSEDNKKSEDVVDQKIVYEIDSNVALQAEKGQVSSDSQGFSQDMQNNNNFIFDNLNQAMNQALQTETVTTGEFDGAVTGADVVRQVVDQIRVNMTKEITSLTIKLNPEQLGNVQITVASKDGIMQARIIAETESAKNAIENSLMLLKETFDNQDLKVDEIEVMVGTGDFLADTERGMDEEEQKGKSENKLGGINLNAISDDEISEDTELEIEMMKAQGNTISYMA